MLLSGKIWAGRFLHINTMNHANWAFSAYGWLMAIFLQKFQKIEPIQVIVIKFGRSGSTY